MTERVVEVEGRGEDRSRWRQTVGVLRMRGWNAWERSERLRRSWGDRWGVMRERRRGLRRREWRVGRASIPRSIDAKVVESINLQRKITE